MTTSDGRPHDATATAPPAPAGDGSATARRTASIRLAHQVGERAVDWLYRHRDGFRLDDEPDPEIGVMGRFKPLGELAQIGIVIFREGVAGSRQSELARKLLDHAWRELLDGGAALVTGQRREPISPIPFEVYLPFRELGYRQPEIERAVRINHRLGSWGAFEVLPMRRLGLSVFERRFGLAPSVPVEEAAARTWLAHRPEPWTVEGHIGYDITHTVFHLTDWGEHPEGLPRDIADYLAVWLPVWLDDWLDLRRWDLLGELMAVDACLPEPALDETVWQGFAQAQQPDGAVPTHDDMPDGDPHEVFDLVYHSTLVAAFASTLAVSRAMTELAGAPS